MDDAGCTHGRLRLLALKSRRWGRWGGLLERTPAPPRKAPPGRQGPEQGESLARAHHAYADPRALREAPITVTRRSPSDDGAGSLRPTSYAAHRRGSGGRLPTTGMGAV